ncbi:hypothetical protein ACFL5O_10090, partial [Myxococcota bacterium]
LAALAALMNVSQHTVIPSRVVAHVWTHRNRYCRGHVGSPAHDAPGGERREARSRLSYWVPSEDGDSRREAS